MASSASSKSLSRQIFTLTPVALVMLLFLLAMIALSIFVHNHPASPFDLQLLKDIQGIHAGVFDAIMRVVGLPGYPPQVYVLVLLIFVIFWSLKLKWEALMHAFATVGIGFVGYIPKVLVQRPRPPAELLNGGTVLDGGTLSYPAGHVQSYVAIIGFLLYLSWVYLPKNSITRWLSVLVYGFMIAFIGVSRVYLGEHWLSDAIGGYLLGALWLWMTVNVYEWGKGRFFVKDAARKKK